MKSRTTSGFRKSFASLPAELQDRAREAFQQFLDDPDHPGLRLKQVHPSEPIYSARISLHYRALARRGPEHWVWFWIGSHSDYDKLLRNL